jgi:hypothetical protein
MKSEPEHTVDLLRKLREISDPRRREGKLYPLHSLLGMLILAALNGESSLRGMVMWGGTSLGLAVFVNPKQAHLIIENRPT